jgi:hypothetical protein
MMTAGTTETRSIVFSGTGGSPPPSGLVKPVIWLLDLSVPHGRPRRGQEQELHLAVCHEPWPAPRDRARGLPSG